MILQRLQSITSKTLRVAYAAARGFWEDDCYTKASTLTFYTLQSIIPFLAAALAIAKGFGFDDYLEKLLTTTFAEQKEILNYAIQFALSMLSYISSGEIVGVGVILLLWTNINLVGYIEVTLNQIWKVKASRSLFQKIKDFCTAVVVFPLIFVASSSATVFVKAKLDTLPYFAALNKAVLHETTFFVPWLLSCSLFATLYFLIPNARLRVVPRLTASVLAGTAFQVWQMVFINLQLYIFSYNIVYGAFALLPLFLIWLQFSWIITLAGAEIAAHIENDRYCDSALGESGLAKMDRCELALLLLHECLAAFYAGRAPPSAEALAAGLDAPPEAVDEVLELLSGEGILLSFANADGEKCYSLMNDPGRLKILTICDLIERQHEREIIAAASPLLPQIRGAVEAIHLVSADSPANRPLKELFRI